MEEAARPLPYMYGSPEYLQVCTTAPLESTWRVRASCCLQEVLQRAIAAATSAFSQRGGAFHQEYRSDIAGRLPLPCR